MNDLFVLLGIQSWKPVLTALALPPVPFLLLMLVGARMMFWRRSVSWLLMLIGAAGVWLCCTVGLGLDDVEPALRLAERLHHVLQRADAFAVDGGHHQVPVLVVALVHRVRQQCDAGFCAGPSNGPRAI